MRINSQTARSPLPEALPVTCARRGLSHRPGNPRSIVTVLAGASTVARRLAYGRSEEEPNQAVLDTKIDDGRQVSCRPYLMSVIDVVLTLARAMRGHVADA